MTRILIIDDENIICRLLTQSAEALGHEAFSANTLAEGLELAYSELPDVVFLDVFMPDGNGLDALPEIRQVPSSPEVVIITGSGDSEGAALAIKTGAWDYIQKPFSMEEFRLNLLRVSEYREKKGSGKRTVFFKREDIIGNDPRLTPCLDMAAQCANNEANVMITGETGTGKEVFARAIHRNSARAGKNFVVVDCTVLPEQLVESVLFGHVQGAFTGANRSRDGLILQAHGGTLFLDEVGELPPAVQKAFLRVLQERRFRPVGSTDEIHSDFRLISATNRNLDRMVEAGLFRRDLMFRLQTFTIELPPLRNRVQDIRDLIVHYIYRLCRNREMKAKGVSPEFMDILTACEWPGNIRELISTLEKAIFAEPDSPTLYPMHLPDAIRIRHIQSSVLKKQRPQVFMTAKGSPAVRSGGINTPLPPLKAFREAVVTKVEQEYLTRLMTESGGEIEAACRISGLSRARLYALMKKYGVNRRAVL